MIKAHTITCKKCDTVNPVPDSGKLSCSGCGGSILENCSMVSCGLGVIHLLTDQHAGYVLLNATA